jgi:hypothetical protein
MVHCIRIFSSPSRCSYLVHCCVQLKCLSVIQVHLAAAYEDTDEEVHEVLVSEAQMLSAGTSFFKRICPDLGITRPNIDDVQQQQQDDRDNVDFCIERRLPTDALSDATVDGVSTSAFSNRIQFASCLDDAHVSNERRISAVDEQATVRHRHFDSAIKEAALDAVEISAFVSPADCRVDAVGAGTSVKRTAVCENSLVLVAADGIIDSSIRCEQVSDVLSHVSCSRRGPDDRNKNVVDDGDGHRRAVAEDGVLSGAVTTMSSEAESEVIIVRMQAAGDDECHGHARRGKAVDVNEDASDNTSIACCRASDGSVDGSTTPIDGDDDDADLSINGDEYCRTESVHQSPLPAADHPSSDRLCGEDRDLCIVDKFPDGFDAAASASDIHVNEPCR